MQASIAAEWFLDKVCENPTIAELLRMLPNLELRQCYLTAGCLCQTMWNYRSGQPLDAAIKDHDIAYFDDQDLSWEAEDRAIQKANDQFGIIARTAQIRNQGRVHLRYGELFGENCPQLQSATDGIDRFLISCTGVGINVATKELYAPNGLEDLWEGVLRTNPINPRPNLFQRKSANYKVRWPWLTILTDPSA